MMVKKVLYNIRIIFALVKYHFKNLTNYRKAFWIGLFMVIINMAISLSYIELLYNNTPTTANIFFIIIHHLFHKT